MSANKKEKVTERYEAGHIESGPSVSRRKFLTDVGLLGVTAIGAGGLLAACGSGSEPVAKASSSSSSSSKTAPRIRSSSLKGTLSIMDRWSTPVELVGMTKFFADFQKSYPGIHVSNDHMPTSGKTYQPAVRDAFASGSPPDIATDIAGPEVYALAEAGVLMDLTDFYDRVIKARSLGSATTGAVLNGKVWGINSGISVGNILWYNPKYLAKYGLKGDDVRTFPEWVDQLKIIKAKGGTPIALGEESEWPGGHYLNDLVQRTLGNEAAATLYNRTVVPGAPSTPKWTDPAVVKAFELLVSLKPYFQPGFLGENTSSADALFLDGRAGWHEMGSWLAGTIESQPPAFEPGMILFPTVPGYPGLQKDITIAATSMVVSKHANPDIVEAFFKYFTEPSNSATLEAIKLDFSPYSLGSYSPPVPKLVKPEFDRTSSFIHDAGKGGAILFNDEAVNVTMYPQYIWEGSVGLLSGSITPERLCTELESATVAFQASHK